MTDSAIQDDHGTCHTQEVIDTGKWIFKESWEGFD